MKEASGAGKQRQAEVDHVKRDIIRRAAKSLFIEYGLEGTSVREIARLAGYTTGAIYFHYENKEALYADVLEQSLRALHQSATCAAEDSSAPLEGIAAAFRALVSFYQATPVDLDLSLYLFQGAKPRGLTPAANQKLNELLMATMDVFRTRLQALGVPEADLSIEVAGIFDEMIGILISSNTGRLRLFKVDSHVMTEHHIENLMQRMARRK